MSRAFVNLLLDLVLMVLLVTLVGATLILRIVFPSATQADGWRLWGLGYDGWTDVQFALLALLFLGAVVHVMLHWTWVCGIVSRRVLRRQSTVLEDGTMTLYGVGLLAVIFGFTAGLVLAASLTVIPRAT